MTVDVQRRSALASTPMRVVIVGGGLAGMAAAAALESAGADVILLEARRALGGRAGAYQDPETGETLDNCQHVLLGCCTNLIDFYRRIGASNQIRFEPAIRFFDDQQNGYALRATPGLPAPLHLAMNGLRRSFLSVRERAEFLRAALAMMRVGRDGRKTLANVPFGEWLDEHRQSAGLVRKLYEPVLVGALNEEVRRASSEYAIQVFQDSLFANSRGWHLGTPAGTLQDLYQASPCRDLRLGVRVDQVVVENDRAAGIRLANGETITADAVVLAINHHGIGKWIPDEWLQRDERFRDLEKLESVPILGTHLWFDRPVMSQAHAALLAGPLQWIFRKDTAGCVVKGVISAAREWVGESREEMIELFNRQLVATLPGARNAKLMRGTVVIEKRATFAAIPGVDRYRPTQAPSTNGLPGLYLAGDYTLTGWPATMEGAVRSGYLAAEAILPGGKFLQPDLPVQWPARLLGL